MDDPLSALMPMMTLTVGEGDINGGGGGGGGKSSADSFRSSPGTSMLHSPGDEDHFGGGNGSGGDSDLDNDPNRFNAYLNRGSELWTHWLWLGGQGKMSLMRCNYCQVNKQLKNAPKCRRHLIKCPKTPEPVRRYFEKKEVEATRVSALMRELRSKEIKFPRNSVPPPSDPSHSGGGGGHHGKVSSDNSSNNSHHNHHHHHNNKVPIPTANDLKHLQQKQHSTSLNSVIVNKQQPSNGHGHGHGNGTGGHGLGSSGSTGSASPADMSLSGSPKFSGVSAKSAENHHHHHHQGHHHHQQQQHHLSSSSSTLDIKPVVHSSPLMLNGKSAKHDNLNGGGNGNHAAAAAAALRNNDNNSAFLNGISLYYQQLLYLQQTNGGNGIGDNSSSIDLSSKSSSAASHSSGKRSASQRDLDYNTLQLLLQNGSVNHNLFNHNISSSSSSSSGKQKRPKRESLLTPSPAHHNQQQQQQHHHRDALSLISHQLNHGNGNGSAGSGGGGNGSGGGGNGNGLHILSTTNKENKAHPNNTVVINLDDVNALDESVFFNNGLGGGGGGGGGFHHQMPQLLPPPQLMNGGGGGGGGGGGSRKKRFRESVIQSSSNNNGSTSSNGRLQHDATNGNGSTGMHNQIKTANGNNNGSNGHTVVAEFSRFNPAELEVLHDDLNDLLASALLSAGVDFDFVGNAFFAQFINQLVTLSSAMGKASSNGGGSGIQYRLPPADKLLTSNLTNLVRKFDHETVKIFADADSIVVSLDWSSVAAAGGGFSVIAKTGQQQQNQISFDVNLLLCSSNNALSGGQQQQLFYRTIPAALGSEGDDEGQRTTAAAAMLTQVSAVIEKVGAEQIHALVLPLDQDQDIGGGGGGGNQSSSNSSSSLPSAGTIITAFLATAHSHIVPLSNSYQLFSRLLCDICRIPAIHRLLAQCTGLFKDLARLRHCVDFQAENEQHWKRVFESDSLKFYLHFLRAAEGGGNGNDPSATTSAVPPTNHWVSLNLVLCWFLVAKSSITDLFNKMARKAEEEEKDGDETEGEEEEEAKAGEKKQGSSEEDSSLESLLAKHDLRPDQIERFFTQIHVLFNFLTPFITAVHLIENDSCVISDIVKIYFDVKMTIGADCSCLFEGGSNSNGEQGVGGGMSSAKLERQSLDVILHRYLQEGNLSRYLYLAFYLDPRFRSDKRLEENEELISAVYDTLFHYATALGCVVAGEEEDRERLVDALEEFRNGEKLYGTALLKSPKSPVKYWKHLQRFPASAKLAYCASRLLSISTRAMLIGGGGSGSSPPVADVSTASLQRRLLALDASNASSSDFEPKVGEKLLPVKSYLKLQLSTASAEAAAAAASHFDDEEGGRTGSSGLVSSQPNLLSATDLSSTAAPTSTTSSSPSSSSTPSSPDSISNIIANVITSLDHYSRSSAQPFTGADLARLTQTTSYTAAASSSSSSAT